MAQYTVLFVTTDIQDAGTDGNVAVELRGSQRSWPPLWLETRHEAFEQARIDCFRISDEHVAEFGELGEPEELTVHFEGVGDVWRWHLSHVELWRGHLDENCNVGDTGSELLVRFTFNLWFNKPVMRVTRAPDTIDFGERARIPHRYLLRRMGRIEDTGA
jgi:hypothetical protein